ncbi:protein-disulfide reductase DsbD [Oceaniserpentilla sp. 4NH20-0058]|uniref:protein-disulfide reductase DsbD n=1 Tax=Oceaniserpentilla sp. 4NH20-0058 TaxID=3127660 RepID=UPI0031070F9B
MKQTLLALSVFVSWFFVSALGHAQEPDFLPVDQAFSYESIYQYEKLTIKFDIANDYYLYLSRLSLKQDGKTLPFTTIEAPIDKNDEYFGLVKIFKHTVSLVVPTLSNSPVTLEFQGCAEAGLCYPPQQRIIDLNIIEAPTTQKQVSQPLNSDDVSSIAAFLQSGSLLWQMLIFFALGVGLAFTPCVFPMIPILSSIIVGQGESITTRRAFIMSLTYVLAMAIAYASAGVLVGYFGAKANIQLYLQSPWVLGSFAFVFVLLSFAMFGFYELQLPRAIQDKLNQINHNQKGGQLISVAIMGVLSALVVSPCVSAPLAGTLVYISTTGDSLLGGAALLALGLGMGLPLLLIGTGGSRFLPKAGIWMNAVKSVFGVALLAVAIWLLERIIPASITMMLWAVLLITSGVYLGALEQGTHSWGRLFKSFGLILSIYGVLLMVGASAGETNPLQPLSFTSQSHIPVNNAHSMKSNNHSKITTNEEFKQQLQLAKQHNQIAVLDFYADWCIACKIMDAEIFSQPDIQQAMSNVVFIQLDMTNNSEDQMNLLNQFGLFGPPAVLFFKEGKELKPLRIIGEVDKATFAKQLTLANQ